MFLDIFKYYIIYIFNIYLSIKLLNHKTVSFKLHVFIQLLAFLLSFITNIFSSNFTTISHFAPLLLLWSIMAFYTARPQIAFIYVVISFGISYCAHAFSSFISTLVIYLLTQNLNKFSFLAVLLLASCFQALFLLFLIKTKRLKRGLPLLHSTNYINIFTLLCLLFISLPTLSPLSTDPFGEHVLVFIVLIVILAFLIYWWQAQITKAYRHSLQLREQESKRIADLEKDILLQKLLKENERLAAITHRDNTLITTLSNATLNYLYTDYSDSEEANKVRDELAENIKALSAGRTILPDNYNEKQARDFDTSFSLLNKLLHQADADAIQSNITFSVHFGVILDEFVPKDISEIDLVYMVDDLLKNAFKATRNSEPRMVQLQFYRLGKHFVVEVADNGIPFETRSLVNMGIEKLTTYEDGSGIGLMNIWDTKEKCGATYHLEEYVTPSPFSKKISLTFDKKNRYSIRTWRKDEILQMSRRADLQVYEHIE